MPNRSVEELIDLFIKSDGFDECSDIPSLLIVKIYQLPNLELGILSIFRHIRAQMVNLETHSSKKSALQLINELVILIKHLPENSIRLITKIYLDKLKNCYATDIVVAGLISLLKLHIVELTYITISVYDTENLPKNDAKSAPSNQENVNPLSSYLNMDLGSDFLNDKTDSCTESTSESSFTYRKELSGNKHGFEGSLENEATRRSDSSSLLSSFSCRSYHEKFQHDSAEQQAELLFDNAIKSSEDSIKDDYYQNDLSKVSLSSSSVLNFDLQVYSKSEYSSEHLERNEDSHHSSSFIEVKPIDDQIYMTQSEVSESSIHIKPKSVYLINFIMEKVFISIYTPRCAQPLRASLYELFDLYISNYSDLINSDSLKTELMCNVCAHVENEKDPRNLLIIFPLLENLILFCEPILKHNPQVLDLVGDALFVYFPIHFKQPKTVSCVKISAEQLKSSLIRCFFVTPVFSQLLFHTLSDLLLDSESSNEDTLDTLELLETAINHHVYDSSFEFVNHIPHLWGVFKLLCWNEFYPYTQKLADLLLSLVNRVISINLNNTYGASNAFESHDVSNISNSVSEYLNEVTSDCFDSLKRCTSENPSHYAALVVLSTIANSKNVHFTYIICQYVLDFYEATVLPNLSSRKLDSIETHQFDTVIKHLDFIALLGKKSVLPVGFSNSIGILLNQVTSSINVNEKKHNFILSKLLQVYFMALYSEKDPVAAFYFCNIYKLFPVESQLLESENWIDKYTILIKNSFELLESSLDYSDEDVFEAIQRNPFVETAKESQLLFYNEMHYALISMLLFNFISKESKAIFSTDVVAYHKLYIMTFIYEQLFQNKSLVSDIVSTRTSLDQSQKSSDLTVLKLETAERQSFVLTSGLKLKLCKEPWLGTIKTPVVTPTVTENDGLYSVYSKHNSINGDDLEYFGVHEDPQNIKKKCKNRQEGFSDSVYISATEASLDSFDSFKDYQTPNTNNYFSPCNRPPNPQTYQKRTKKQRDQEKKKNENTNGSIDPAPRESPKPLPCNQQVSSENKKKKKRKNQNKKDPFKVLHGTSSNNTSNNNSFDSHQRNDSKKTNQTSQYVKTSQIQPIHEYPLQDIMKLLIAQEQIDENSYIQESINEASVDEESVIKEPIKEAFINEDSVQEELRKKYSMNEESIKEDSVKEYSVKKDSLKEAFIEQVSTIKETFIEDIVKEDSVKKNIIKDEPKKEESFKEEPIKEKIIKQEIIKQEIIKEEPSIQIPIKEDIFGQEPMIEVPIIQENIKKELCIHETHRKDITIVEPIIKELLSEQTIDAKPTKEESNEEKPIYEEILRGGFFEKELIRDENFIESLIEGEFIEEVPVNKEHINEEPIQFEPTLEKPIVEEPVEGKPLRSLIPAKESEPVVEELIETELKANFIKDEPIVEKPIEKELTVEDPISEIPLKEELVEEGPHKEEIIQEEPHKEEIIQEGPHKEEIIQEEPHKEEFIQEEPHKEEIIQEGPHKEEIIQEGPHKEEIIQEEPHKEEIIQEEPHKEEFIQEEPHKEEFIQEEPHKEEFIQEGPHKEEIIQEGPHKEEIIQEEPHKEEIIQEEPHKEEFIQEEPHKEEIIQEGPHKEEFIQEEPHKEEFIQEEPHKEEFIQEGPHKEEIIQEGPHKEEIIQEEPHKEEIIQEEPHKEEFIQEEPHKEEIIQEGPHKEEIIQEEPHKEEFIQEEPHKEEFIQEGPHKEEIIQEGPHKEEIIQEEPHKEEIIQEEPHKEEFIQEEPHKEEIIQEGPHKEEIIQEEPHKEEINNEEFLRKQILDEVSLREEIDNEKVTRELEPVIKKRIEEKATKKDCFEEVSRDKEILVDSREKLVKDLGMDCDPDLISIEQVVSEISGDIKKSDLRRGIFDYAGLSDKIDSLESLLKNTSKVEGENEEILSGDDDLAEKIKSTLDETKEILNEEFSQIAAKISLANELLDVANQSVKTAVKFPDVKETQQLLDSARCVTAEIEMVANELVSLKQKADSCLCAPLEDPVQTDFGLGSFVEDARKMIGLANDVLETSRKGPREAESHAGSHAGPRAVSTPERERDYKTKSVICLPYLRESENKTVKPPSIPVMTQKFKIMPNEDRTGVQLRPILDVQEVNVINDANIFKTSCLEKLDGVAISNKFTDTSNYMKIEQSNLYIDSDNSNIPNYNLESSNCESSIDENSGKFVETKNQLVNCKNHKAVVKWTTQDNIKLFQMKRSQSSKLPEAKKCISNKLPDSQDVSCNGGDGERLLKSHTFAGEFSVTDDDKRTKKKGVSVAALKSVFENPALNPNKSGFIDSKATKPLATYNVMTAVFDAQLDKLNIIEQVSPLLISVMTRSLYFSIHENLETLLKSKELLTKNDLFICNTYLKLLHYVIKFKMIPLNDLEESKVASIVRLLDKHTTGLDDDEKLFENSRILLAHALEHLDSNKKVIGDMVVELTEKLNMMMQKQQVSRCLSLISLLPYLLKQYFKFTQCIDPVITSSILLLLDLLFACAADNSSLLARPQEATVAYHTMALVMFKLCSAEQQDLMCIVKSHYENMVLLKLAATSSSDDDDTQQNICKLNLVYLKLCSYLLYGWYMTKILLSSSDDNTNSSVFKNLFKKIELLTSRHYEQLSILLHLLTLERHKVLLDDDYSGCSQFLVQPSKVSALRCAEFLYSIVDRKLYALFNCIKFFVIFHGIKNDVDLDRFLSKAANLNFQMVISNVFETFNHKFNNFAEQIIVDEINGCILHFLLRILLEWENAEFKGFKRVWEEIYAEFEILIKYLIFQTHLNSFPVYRQYALRNLLIIGRLAFPKNISMAPLVCENLSKPLNDSRQFVRSAAVICKISWDLVR